MAEGAIYSAPKVKVMKKGKGAMMETQINPRS